MKPHEILADLKWLASETALAHHVAGDTKTTDNIRLLKFLTATYAHNQRRIWEQRQGKPLPFDPTRQTCKKTSGEKPT